MDIRKLAEVCEVIEKLAALLPESERDNFREIAQMKVDNYHKLMELMEQRQEPTDEPNTKE